MITINWSTKVITVPVTFMTLVSGVPGTGNNQSNPALYELDVNALRLALKDIEDSDGMPFLDTHRHNGVVTISGVSYARTFEVINGYTVKFDETTYDHYSVRCAGANHNIADVRRPGTVSLIIGNSAGLIQTSGGSGASAAEVWSYPSRTLTVPGSIASIPLTYRADAASQSESIPADGHVRWNTVTQTSATELYVSHMTHDGLDTAGSLDTIPAGSRIYIQDRDSAANFQRWLINAHVDTGGFHTLEVTLVEAGGTQFNNNHELVLVYESAMLDYGLTQEQAVMLEEIYQRLGLRLGKPLTQTQTQISTDDLTLAVAEGGGAVTVTRQ